MLRFATPPEVQILNQFFSTIHVLSTPADIWSKAAIIGQACKANGFTIQSLDLIIAAIAIHYQAVVVTFDADYAQIAKVTQLQVNVLIRP